MSFHAKLSPSSSHRWMNCAGSVALIGDEPNSAGIEAMRGTAAHKVIEVMIQNNETDATRYHNFMILVHIPSTKETLLFPPGTEIPINADWHLFVCEDKMVDGVQMFMDEHHRIINDECFDPEVHSERFLDMSWLDPRLGGTADDTIVDVSWIHLLDYKNGRIVVEVKGNEQMKNYAVGLLHEHPDARGVTVHLVQPNAIHEDGCIRTESYTADELKLFEIRMKQAADATSQPNAPRKPGEWCTYCPAKQRCNEFEAIARDEAGADFASDPIDAPLPAIIQDFVLDEDDGIAYRASLSRKAKWIPVLDAWAKEINKAIFNELMNGREVPGKKLVQAKSNRKYIDDVPTTVAALVAEGLSEDQLYSAPELISPAQVERVRPLPEGMKPKRLKEIVNGLAHKPPGRITVADADDPRSAIDSATASANAALADFAVDPAEGDDSDFGVA